MSCFPCFGSGKKKNAASDTGYFEAALPPRAYMSPPLAVQAPRPAMAPASTPAHIMGAALATMLPMTQAAETRRPEHHAHKPSTDDASVRDNIVAQAFAFRELATATNHFMPDNLLAEGGFFRVYKGCLEKTGQTVAIKQLDRHGFQGNKEFLTEVAKLSHLHHENLINLIGYCADGDQRLLVYEYMPSGSLEDHLLDQPSDKKPIDWYTRMKVAYGAAQGLEYLHETANPPVIYMDFRASHILLDKNFMAKLADFGLVKLGPMGANTPVSSPMMGSYGYCAPEYDRSGQLTLKSDVYSFGVVLLELISGRRAIDTTRPMDEQNLVTWAKPMFKDQKRYHELVDPLIKGDYPAKGLNQVVAMAAMCLQDEDSVRPLMADVVMTLGFLTTAPPKQSSSNPLPASPTPIPAPKEDEESNHSDTSSSSEGDEDEDDEEEDEDEGIEELQ